MGKRNPQPSWTVFQKSQESHRRGRLTRRQALSSKSQFCCLYLYDWPQIRTLPEPQSSHLENGGENNGPYVKVLSWELKVRIQGKSLVQCSTQVTPFMKAAAPHTVVTALGGISSVVGTCKDGRSPFLQPGLTPVTYMVHLPRHPRGKGICRYN